MKNRTKLIAAAVVLALVGGYTAYWFTMANEFDRAIDSWVGAQRQVGLTVDYVERTSVTGFPFAFRTTFRKPHIAGALNGQYFDWRGPDVEARLSPVNLFAITLESPGHHVIDLGAGPAFLDAAGLEVRLDSGSATATFGGASLTLPDQRTLAASSGNASVTAPPSPPKLDSDPLLQFAAEAKDLRLPEGITLLTADPLSEVQVAGTVKGPLPAPPLRDALATWRDAGGTLDLSRFSAAQATLSLSGSATIALDNDLQPIVAADVKARGLGPTIDLLASQKRIYPEDALKMKLFVKGAERDAPGGYKEVATGLTLQGGYLSWGPFKIAKVPPVQWPQ